MPKCVLSNFGLFKTEVVSPIDGQVINISKVTGQVVISEKPLPIEVDAYIPGKINKVYNLTMNVGGGKRNATSLKNLTKYCQQITLNKIKISPKKVTSNYDIPKYITNNSKVRKLYKWIPKKNFLDIIQDVHEWMIFNKKILKKYIR